MKNIIVKFVFLTAVAVLGIAPLAHATTYTSDPNVVHFTSLVSSYATFTNYSNNDAGVFPSFTPTSDELVDYGYRVYNGTFPSANTNLPANNWILATFPSAVSTIIVFPNMDHPGSAYDGYQYQIYGSNNGMSWTPLFDATGVIGTGEPFTLGAYTHTAPSSVNNVLSSTCYIIPGPFSNCVGYEAQFNFGTAYKYYAFGASSVAVAAGNADQEFSAVGALVAPVVVSTAGPVYVSGGPYIYSATTSGLAKVYDATLNDNSMHNFSSLAIGPDNADSVPPGNAMYPFLIYACDTSTNSIIRFAPPASAVTTTNPVWEYVYNGGAESVPTPVCGRFSSTGDLYVTDQAASGTNVYKFANVANVSFPHFTATPPTTVPITGLSANVANAGITQKNVGDLLLVDKTDNQVLRAPFGTSLNPFATAVSYIREPSGSSPVGIARISTGDVFVANGGSSNVAHFDRTGTPVALASCPSLTFPTGVGASTNTTLFYLAAAENDTIYAATSTSNSVDFAEDSDYIPEPDDPPGQIWTWSPGQACTLNSVTTSPTLLSGIAVAPVPTAPIHQALVSPMPPAAPMPTTFNFNSSVFQITANGCSANVTAYPLSLATVIKAISMDPHGLPYGATPLVNLGEAGYETAYVATYPFPPASPACVSVFSDHVSIANAIFGLYDTTLASNPRLIQCDSTVSADTANEPLLGGSTTCQALTTIGSYPLGGLIPNDGGTIGKSHGNSVFFLVNANFAPASAGGNALFCGLFPPLKNTTDPAQASTFDADDIVPIVFRLAKSGGNCRTGPFINNAQALLSIAQIADGNGVQVFNPLFSVKTLFNQGANFPNVFSFYTLFLPVHANQLAFGTYSLSVLFETDNTSEQTIVFKVVPGR